MTTLAKRALFALFVLLALAGWYCIFAMYAARKTAEAVQGLVQALPALADAAREKLKPLLEADFVARYNAAANTFGVRSRGSPDQSSQVSEREFTELIAAAGPARPSVVVISDDADFPEAAQREAFQSRLRSSLETAGASSVLFVFPHTGAPPPNSLLAPSPPASKR